MKNKLILFLRLIIVKNYYRMKKLLFTILTILLLLIIAENFHWYTRVFLEGPDNKVITIFRPLSIWQSGNYFYFIPYKYTNIFAPSDDYYIRPIRLGRDDIDDFALDWGNSANDKIVIYDEYIENKLKSAVIGDYHNLDDKQKENLLGYDLTYTLTYNSNAGWGVGALIFLLFYPILTILILVAFLWFIINTVSILIATVRNKEDKLL